MKKFLMAACAFLFSGFALADNEHQFNENWLPDFRLNIQPYLFNENYGGSALFEGGRELIRCNGTVGAVLSDSCFGKFSVEFLSQHLGFVFCSGREHHWLRQGAIGAAFIYPVADFPLEFQASYSHAMSKKLNSKVIPRQNVICDRGIAGSNGFSLSCGTSVSLWESGYISGSLVYDYVLFDRHLNPTKAVQGVGATFSLDQGLFSLGLLHLGVNVQAPYISYDARLSTMSECFGIPFDIGVYGQRVHGLKSIPNSSRIGIEIGFDFEKMISKDCDEEPSAFRCWLNKPAVYMPEVLVMRDNVERSFGVAPEVISLIGDIAVPVGAFSFDLSSYFSGTSHLIFSLSPLPPGLNINPVSGNITGMVDGSVTGSFTAIAKATNYFGSASQIVIFNF